MQSYGTTELVRRQGLGPPELAGQPLLVRVAGTDEDRGRRRTPARRGEVVQRGGDEQANVPAPMTATTSPAAMGAPSTAWTAQATGSTVTASSSLSASGTP